MIYDYTPNTAEDESEAIQDWSGQVPSINFILIYIRWPSKLEDILTSLKLQKVFYDKLNITDREILIRC